MPCQRGFYFEGQLFRLADLGKQTGRAGVPRLISEVRRALADVEPKRSLEQLRSATGGRSSLQEVTEITAIAKQTVAVAVEVSQR